MGELCVLIAEDSFNCHLQLLSGGLQRRQGQALLRGALWRTSSSRDRLQQGKFSLDAREKISPWQWTGAQRGCEILSHNDIQNLIIRGFEQHGLALKFTLLWAGVSFQTELCFDLMNLDPWSLTLQSYTLAIVKTIFPDPRDSLATCCLQPQKEHFLLHQSVHPEWMYCPPCSYVIDLLCNFSPYYPDLI